jgi:hypothetical protein
VTWWQDYAMPGPPVAAEPRRQPREAFRVRWTRPHWATDSAGRPRWGHRWFAQEAAAMRLCHRLHHDGARVELDVFDLTTARSITWRRDDEEPAP